MLPKPYALGTEQVAFLHEVSCISWHCPSHPPTHHRLECGLHGAFTVVFTVPGTALGVLKLFRKYLLNDWTERVPCACFSPEWAGMRGRGRQQRKWVKKGARKYPYDSHLNQYHSPQGSRLPRSELALALACSFRDLSLRGAGTQKQHPQLSCPLH